MCKPPRIALFFLAGCLGAADGPWKVLFDGKTFANWQPAPTFTIEDGCLKSVKNPAFTEDLFSKDTYSDFELEFDWKISAAGNSGVKYRIQDHVVLLDKKLPRFEDQVNAALKNRRKDKPARGQDYVVGFEYQVIDNNGHPDALRGGALHRTGALYDMFPPITDASKPVGEFNHSRLVVKGDHVEQWLNGVKVVDASLKAPEVAANTEKRWGKDSPVYDLLVRQPRKECHISLQNHGNEAWFKNIRIRRLD
jgi:hypothetical protein